MTDTKFYQSIPFQEKGRGIDGCDCWGLVVVFYKREYGILLPSLDEVYSHTADPTLPLTMARRAETSWINLYGPDLSGPALAACRPRREREGDVILSRFKGLPWHVGIVLDGGAMLHIEAGTNVLCESYSGLKWQNRILGFYRHPELAALRP